MKAESSDLEPGPGRADAAAPLVWAAPVPEARRRKRWAVLLVAAAVFLIGTLAYGHIWLGLFGAMAILGSTNEVLFTARYRLDAKSARSRVGLSVNEIAWPSVRRVIPDAEGVRLSPLPKESRLDAFRGVYLRFAGNREEVMARIEQSVIENATILGTRTDG
jgi:hypothetical protein